MDESQAKRILGITGADDARTAKMKFRRLIGKYHPDAAGENSVYFQKQAQQINAAYTLLKNKNFFAGKDSSFAKEEEILWDAPVNENAFADRNIYTPYHMDIDTGGMHQAVARGKYMWNPDEEEFPLFLRSILHVCGDLLDEAEARCDIRGGSGQTRIFFQKRLFHSLILQYVDPLYCLGKVAEPEAAGSNGQKIYRFRAYIGKTESREMIERIIFLQEGDPVYPTSVRDWKLGLKDAQGNALGYLSFAEDELYYCLFPLMKAQLVQVKMAVVRVRKKRERFRYSAEAEIDFRVRLKKEAAHYRNPDGNEEIRRLLTEYERRIVGYAPAR